MRVRYALAVVAAGWAVHVAGCATAIKTASEPVASARPERRARTVDTINDVCPITGFAVDPHGPAALYRNVAVGFCSPSCVRPWMSLTDREKRQRIGNVTLNPRMKNWGRIPRDPFR